MHYILITMSLLTFVFAFYLKQKRIDAYNKEYVKSESLFHSNSILVLVKNLHSKRL